MKKSIVRLFMVLLLIGIIISCEKREDNLDSNRLIAVWYLDKFIDKENSDTLNTPQIKISFQGDNCVTVFAPCNHGQGQFSIDGHNVTVSNLSLTERSSCSSGEEKRFIRNLSGLYLINEDTLRIFSDYDTDMILHKSQITDPYQCDLTTMLIDTIDSNRFYSDDIFSTEYSIIYGKWFVYAKYGGWNDEEYVPDFDFFEVIKNGIYGYTKDFNLLEYGRIQIEKQTDEELILGFYPDIKSDTFGSWSKVFRTVSIYGSDTMVLHDYCLDCYHYNLSRVK